jgi:hypothetical protein
VQVLTPEGQPAAGVDVWVRALPPELEEDLLAHWTKEPERLRPWIMQGGYPSVRTDARGLATLDSRGAAAVGVVLPTAMGATFFPSLEPGDEPTPHVLQLEAATLVEVQVVDETGQPVAGQEVELRLANAQRLAGLEGDARRWPARRGGAWHATGLSGASNRDGRLWLPLRTSQEVEEELGDATYRVAEVSLDLRAYGPIHEEFPLPRTSPVVLRVPSRGILELRLEGFPDGVVPSLVDVDAQSRRDFEPAPPSATGAFRFEPVAVGEQLRVFFHTQWWDPVAEEWSYSPLEIEDQVVEGPEQAGRVTTRTLRFVPPPGIYGQLRVPEHRQEALTRSRSRTSGFTVRGLADRLMYPVEELPLNLFPDGSFHIPLHPKYRPDTPLQVDELDALVFEWLPRTFRVTKPGTEVERRSLLASVPFAASSTDGVIDLGEIELIEDPYLLHVTVKDESGAPVPGADVWVERSFDPAQGLRPSRAASPGFLHGDDRGEVWIQDHDWYSEFGSAPEASRFNHQGPIPSIVVYARREGYADGSVVIPPDQREVEVIVKAAGRAEGSLQLADGLHFVWMDWLPHGAPATSDAEQAVATWAGYGMHLADREGHAEFAIESLPAGRWDVVFSIGLDRSQEALRIPDVAVQAGETCRDPRLQNIDLASQASIYRVRFQDAQGVRVVPPALRARVMTRLGPNHFIELNLLDWKDGQLRLARANGQPLQAFLVSDAWLSVDLSLLTAGDNLVTLHPRRSQVVDTGLPEPMPEGVSWSVSLRSLQPPRETIRVKLDAAGRGDIQLPAVGRYDVGWAALRKNGSAWLTADGGEVLLSLEALLGDAPLRLVPPASFLADLRAGAPD